MIAVAEGHLGGLGPPGVELHVVLFREADGAMALVGHSADPAIGVADPGLGDRDLPFGREAIGQPPRGLVS